MAAHPTDSIPFFAYEWVDDHVLVEPDTPGRRKAARTALRLTMLAVLGPRSINESKFSEWSTKLEVLGLDFDTIHRTVSMPKAKLAKAETRLQSAARKAQLSSHELQCLLGSLRHVATCLRSAKPFYQRLQQAINKAARWQSIPLDDSMRQDLNWCEMILTHGRWWSLPTSMFWVDPEVDIHLYMDASNQGLAVLDPAHRRYIQLQYDDSEQQLLAQAIGTDEFNINVHEQFCIALAAWIWGPKWRNAEPPLLHVRSWTDNTSAAAWTNNMYSSNRIAQELNRAIGFAEITLGFRISAEHLPGACNIGADAGSRAWTAPHGNIWTNLTSSWTQDPVPQQIRYIYKTFSMNYKPDHLQTTATGSIQEPGRSGRRGASRKDSRRGWKAPATPSPVSWPYSLFPDGYHTMTSPETLPAPCCTNSPKSLGIIADIGESLSDSMLDTCWLCKGCSGCRGLQHKTNRHPKNPSSAPQTVQLQQTP